MALLLNKYNGETINKIDIKYNNGAKIVKTNITIPIIYCSFSNILIGVSHNEKSSEITLISNFNIGAKKVAIKKINAPSEKAKISFGSEP